MASRIVTSPVIASPHPMVPAARMARIVLAVLAVLVVAAPPVAAADADALPDRTIRAAMEIWQVPGVAVTVIRGDGPAVTRSYGLRDVERRLPVTPRTLFAVGSIAKSFTTLALSMLADEGRFDWDAPVRRFVPDFRLHGDALSGAVTGRDLATHRTGVPRHDALWYLGAYDRDALMARLRFLPPAAGLGKVFAYSNLMAAAAGHVLARVEGAPWEAVIRRRVLDPLGMTAARLSLNDFRAAPDRASPYFPGDDGRIPIPLRDTTAIAPAAAVYADAIDMGRYLRLLIGDGMVEGRRLLSRAAARDLRHARMATGAGPRWPELAAPGYAMGFYVSRYRGRALAYHTGVIDGFAAMISFLPDERTGVVVLTNMSGANPLPSVLSYAIYDALLDLPPLPWVERLRTRHAAWRSARTAALAQEQRDRGSRKAVAPSRPLAAYEGDYNHPAYGRMRIRAATDQDGGPALAGALHDIRFTLLPGGGDAWRVAETAWPLRAGLAVRFLFDGGIQAAHLATPLADGPTYRLQAGDIVFSRGGGGGKENPASR